jgi:hypothetical protein
MSLPEKHKNPLEERITKFPNKNSGTRDKKLKLQEERDEKLYIKHIIFKTVFTLKYL